MNKNKKGVVLILTLVVTSLLLSFAAAIAAIAANSYNLTIISERNNKLKLVAESGRERGEVALKNFIRINANLVFNTPDLFNPSTVLSSDIFFSEGNIDCTVSILPDINASSNVDSNLVDYYIPSTTTDPLPKKYPDRATNRMLDYILIRSRAVNNITNEEKTLDTYIDKKDISNVYFDRLFNGSLTVVPSISAITPTPVTPSFSVTGNVKLNLAGTIFLQGSDIILKPNLVAPDTRLQMDEGDIYVKSKNLQVSASLNPFSTLGNNINLYKPSENTTSLPEWKSTLIRGLDMLGVENPLTNALADDFQEIDPTVQDVNPSNIVAYESIDHYPSLITYKIKQAPLKPPIDFNRIMDGKDMAYTFTGLYVAILDKLQSRLPASVDKLEYYGKVYKMLIVDGDLEMSGNTGENVNNYIIYCTGNVKFKGNCKFYNCSLFANSITFDSTVPDFTVTFDGVNTHKAREHIISSTNLFDFSQTDKGTINTYLTNNLQKYADYIKFRTIDWREY